ncbi:hypothetical protein LCGC14_1078590 [marine sediment metagenome]|uniref:Calcineurin-like phosphoesterase domain-containing protein n=1 Tax=marine sediment metagenome TaxID=412755 RepID=A0A0F9MKT9_9ZZZZ
MIKDIEDSLFISDLHSERGYNPSVHSLLIQKEGSRRIYFLGDTRMYPDYYADIPHTPIMGNHEYRIDTVRKGLVDHILLTDEVLLIHGHNEERQAGFINRYFKDIVDFFMTHYGAIKNKDTILPCSGNIVKYTKPEQDNTSMRDTEIVRLVILQKKIAKHFPKVNTIIMGHHHRQYYITIEGCDFFNCGGGFRGEHIEIIGGSLYFCNFVESKSTVSERWL